ncbi:MAG: nuclear transport factor 2 family protein [Paucibacter sp.]|nr:nuclear transport factor 2 family protein [Roseateles sp.]
MDLVLPPPVADYFQAEASSETNALGHCFSDDAVVHDEGKVHRGLEAIKTWKVATRRKYRYRVEPLRSQPIAHGVQVWARLTGASELQAAVTEALTAGVPHPNAVRHALQRARDAAGQPPPTALILPEHVARRDAPVRAHELGSYDRKESDDE